MKTRGIHHVTAIAGDAQRNLDFYVGVLGLRFIKRTVNFDDPYTYHFYFGDETGTPGTILTFFPWSSEGKPGRPGTGQTESFGFSIPRGSVAFWRDRLEERRIKIRDSGERFGEPFLSFNDYDGLTVELVGVKADARVPWDPVVPGEHAVRGFHSVTLLEADAGRTGAFLREHLGLIESGREGARIRFAGDGPAGIVDLRIDPGVPAGQWGTGAVHHVAFRTPDAQGQRETRAAMLRSGVRVTPVADRQYFQSIYFHEPGGVLFELATDGPGFTIDENVEQLGSNLKLPPWYEEGRRLIEDRLPVIIHPDTANAEALRR